MASQELKIVRILLVGDRKFPSPVDWRAEYRNTQLAGVLRKLGESHFHDFDVGQAQVAGIVWVMISEITPLFSTCQEAHIVTDLYVPNGSYVLVLQATPLARGWRVWAHAYILLSPWNSIIMHTVLTSNQLQYHDHYQPAHCFPTLTA